MRVDLPAAIAAIALAATAAMPAPAAEPAAAARQLAAAFKLLCIDSALSLTRLRAAWAAAARDGAPLAERTIEGATGDPQARPGAPKPPPSAGTAADRVRLDGKLRLDAATYDVAAVARKGEDRLDACRIEAATDAIDADQEAVAGALGLEAPTVIGASQSSAYLTDPDPTIFKYVQYRPLGAVAVTIGLELKPEGRGNLLLIAEPAGGN